MLIRRRVSGIKKSYVRWEERRRLKLIRVDSCLLGGDDGVSSSSFTRISSDIRRSSRLISDWPHVKLLRQYDSIGERIWDQGTFEQTEYYRNAVQNIEFLGCYHGAILPNEIHQGARHFVNAYRGLNDTSLLQWLQNNNENVCQYITVNPVLDSKCYEVVNGRHRLAIAYMKGVRDVFGIINFPSVRTPLQNLLLDVLWLNAKRHELYQPINSPEVAEWPLVRRCSDRLAMMKEFLHAEGLMPPATKSYLDIASYYGWFVSEMANAGFQAEGVERDPIAISVGKTVYGLRPEQVHAGDAVEFLKALQDKYDVTSCFSLIHHFIMNRFNVSAEELIHLIDSATRHVMFFDMGQDGEKFYLDGQLAGWNPDHIQHWLEANTTFTHVLRLGKDTDNVPPYQDCYGRTMFVCLRSNVAKVEPEAGPAVRSDTAKTRMKVLILDADSDAGIETIQSLGRHGCIVHTVNLQPERSLRRSRFINRQIKLAAYDDNSIRELVNLFQNENYDLVVPATEVSLLAMISPEIPGDMYRRAVLPSQSSVQIALNKQEVWNLARHLGVRVPSSELVSSSSRPPEAFPVVLKPVLSKINSSGVVQEFSVTIARDVAQWWNALTLTYPGIQVQQQQYIPGRGLGVEMLFEHGTPRWAFLHERVHELPLTGGGSSYRVSLGLKDDLVQTATLLLSALKWHGVAMVEFKVTPSGEAYLMEINPRLWGSLGLAIDCGVNFPIGLLCLSTGQPLPPQPKYRTGYFTRNISRDGEWFKANLKADHSDPLLFTKPIILSAFEWLRPLIGKESWDHFSWSDLGVISNELIVIVRKQWHSVVSVVKRTLSHMYLRYIQQPQTIRRLRRRRINTVLILCHGNICRSPLSSAFAVKKFPTVTFISAGFHKQIGRLCPDFVVDAASKMEINLERHFSKCVDANMIDNAQLILVMDLQNYMHVTKIFPGSRKKTLLLGMFLPKPQLEIKDPYENPDTIMSIASEIKYAVERTGIFYNEPHE